jgi:hypothetical protein
MNCDLVCEDLESFFPLKNMQVEDVRREQLSKIIIGSHEEKPRRPLGGRPLQAVRRQCTTQLSEQRNTYE